MNGPGQCCGIVEYNLFAWFEHYFYRHTPLNLQASLPTWWIPESTFHQEESCQDGYQNMVWVTTFANNSSGTRIRTRTWNRNLYVLDAMTETNSGDSTDYPLNLAGTEYADWVSDSEWYDANPEYLDSTATHLQVKHYFENRYNPTQKLVITTEVTLSSQSTWLSFLARCNTLYGNVTFARILTDAASMTGGIGWLGMNYRFNSSGDIEAIQSDVQIEFDAHFSIASGYFSGMKSLRLPGVTMYESGGTTINARIANPINPAGTYKLLTSTYAFLCYDQWPNGLTPTEACAAQPLGASIEVSAGNLSFVLIQAGTCPP